MSRKYYIHGHVVSEGCVSSGTLRTQDLIKSFCDEIMRYRTVTIDVVYDARAWLEGPAAYMAAADLEECDYLEHGGHLVQELLEELNNMAPDGLEFGTTEGDGACFGWWEVHGEDEGDGEWT